MPRAISSRRLMPPENVLARSLRRSHSSNSVSSFSIRSARASPRHACTARRENPCSRRRSARRRARDPGRRCRSACATSFCCTAGSRPSIARCRWWACSSVVSILMVVVLPAPLGPRKAKISPSCDVKGDVVDGRKVAEVLDQVFDANHRCQGCFPYAFAKMRVNDRLRPWEQEGVDQSTKSE